MLKFSFKNIKIIPLLYIAFVLCTTGLPLYLSGYVFMKKIPLTQGKYAIVDDEDFDYLNQFRWNAIKRGQNFYAHRQSKNSDTDYIPGTSIFMHRVIMKTPHGFITDHKDNNGLNNQKTNIRICTHRQNNMNLPPQKGAASKFKGVSKSGRKSWKALIFVNKRKEYLGSFPTEIEAASAYNKAAVKYFKTFAYLNKI